MKRDLPPDLRALIVKQLGAALAAAWRRQHEQSAPAPKENAA